MLRRTRRIRQPRLHSAHERTPQALARQFVSGIRKSAPPFVLIPPTQALDGLGSILMFERELDAAEFFQRRAMEIVNRGGGKYEAAEIDLQQILAP